jgi:catechol 2,3-dioxygenase-like lactoylglutathione lyase family enzyme
MTDDCQGISHITFIVRDSKRMALLLCEGLGATELYDSANKNFSLSREKFFLLGGVWIAVMEGEPPAERSYQHVAFKVAPAELPAYRAWLEQLGVEIKAPRNRVAGEGESLYFYDFDNHLFELHTGTLEERLVQYDKAGSTNSRGLEIRTSGRWIALGAAMFVIFVCILGPGVNL